MTHLDEQALAAKAWADLEMAASATGALEVARITLPIEKVRALVNERSALPSSPVSELVERLEDVAGFIQKEHGRVAAAACLATEATHALTTLSTRNAELEREVKRLREALSGCFCPRPVNAREYGFTVGECVAAGECGCCDGETLRALSTSPQGGEHE